jgi:hypothetical protein
MSGLHGDILLLCDAIQLCLSVCMGDPWNSIDHEWACRMVRSLDTI